MTKKLKIYQILTFVLGLAFIAICLFVGITAIQKQMKLNLAVKMNPSILCGIYVDDTLVFDNVNSTIGDGVELTANTLKLNSTSTFGQSFNLKIANKNANAIYVTFSGATISGSTSYSTVINASTTSSAMALSSAGMVTITMQQVVQVTTNIVQCTYTTDASSGIIEVNGKKYIPYGGTLKQTFTSNAGYSTPPTLSVTMGGETTTAYTYTNGFFTFSNVTADIVVNASCNPITYTVAYNANGGSGSIASQTHTYGISLALSPCTFTPPANKKFAGWAETSSGAVEYTDGESVINLSTTQDEVVTLYAVWEDAGFTITLNLNGGSYNSSTSNITLSGAYSNLSSATSVVDDYIPTMTNYTFGGWYSDVVGAANVPTTQVKYFSCNYFTDNSISLAQDLTLTGATTLYARWLPFTVGTYSTGTDKPTESGSTVTYTAFAGYKYLKFVGVDTFTYTYGSNTTATTPLRFIVIGAGENVNSAMKGAYEQTSVTKAAFAGTLANTKDTSAVGTNTEIAYNHVLLLSEQLVDRMYYGSKGNWLDTSATTRKFLNETTTATNFLPGSGLDDYVTNGFIVKPSTNTENITLADGIRTAWRSGTTTDNESCIFLLGSRYGDPGSGNASDNGEIVSQTDTIKERYYSQHFVVEDYLGVDTEGVEGGDLVYGDAKLKQFTGLNASYSSSWWLRSGFYDSNNYAYFVLSLGRVSYDGVLNYVGVRPSFILNLA